MKTFILKESFTNYHLDFLCITENWTFPSELSAFSELLSCGCQYFNSPLSSWLWWRLSDCLQIKLPINSCPFWTPSPTLN